MYHLSRWCGAYSYHAHPVMAIRVVFDDPKTYSSPQKFFLRAVILRELFRSRETRFMVREYQARRAVVL